MPKAPKSFRESERKAEREQQRGNCVQRGYDWQWMQISKMKRQRDPVCEYCHEAVAEDVDHVIPFKGINDPLRTDWNNLRSTCRKCHAAKTGKQSG